MTTRRSPRPDPSATAASTGPASSDATASAPATQAAVPARPVEIRAVLQSQYLAALSMLRQAIEQCPPALWLGGEPHAAPYWRVAFHVLFFTHFYLQKDHRSMKRWARHRGQLQDLSGPAADPAQVYTQADMLEYLDFCTTQLAAWLSDLDLGSSDCGFPWYAQGKLEHQLNNIRHVQHHAAQLCGRLRGATGRCMDWR